VLAATVRSFYFWSLFSFYRNLSTLLQCYFSSFAERFIIMHCGSTLLTPILQAKTKNRKNIGKAHHVFQRTAKIFTWRSQYDCLATLRHYWKVTVVDIIDYCIYKQQNELRFGFLSTKPHHRLKRNESEFLGCVTLGSHSVIKTCRCKNKKILSKCIYYKVDYLKNRSAAGTDS